MLFCPFGENLAKFAPTLNKYARWYGICHVKMSELFIRAGLKAKYRRIKPTSTRLHSRIVMRTYTTFSS